MSGRSRVFHRGIQREDYFTLLLIPKLERYLYRPILKFRLSCSFSSIKRNFKSVNVSVNTVNNLSITFSKGPSVSNAIGR